MGEHIPFAVAHALIALFGVQHGEGFVGFDEFVGADTDEEMDVWEEELGLAQLELHIYTDHQYR